MTNYHSQETCEDRVNGKFYESSVRPVCAFVWAVEC